METWLEDFQPFSFVSELPDEHVCVGASECRRFIWFIWFIHSKFTCFHDQFSVATFRFRATIGVDGLTRTRPVSVWAEIMTPAQSLTEVIQPTSLAAESSLSPRLMPSPVVTRWTSCSQRRQAREDRRLLSLISASLAVELPGEASQCVGGKTN